MFFSLAYLQPHLVQLSGSSVFAGVATSGLATYGVYKALSGGLLWLFTKNQKLRKLILGKAYLEGTWVGHYQDGNELRLTKEFIDQSTGETLIHGREFYGTGATRANWTSDTVAIDLRKMQVVYAYTCRVIDRKNVQEGLGVFSMIVQASGEHASILDGYAVDLIDGERDPNKEHKISDSEVTDEKAFSEAKRIFGLS